MELSAPPPGGETPAPADFEVLQHRLVDIGSKVDEMGRRVDEVESFFERKKQLSDSVKKTAGKGKGKKVGIKVPEDEVDAEFMDVDVSDAAPTMRMQEIMRRFGRILNQILQHQWAEPFMDPVDVEGLQLHDYYEIIKKPMDFNTIKTRMEAKDGTGYKNVREIYADVRLVFTNAMTYNGEKNEYHIMAKTLLRKFEDKWLHLLPMVLKEERKQEESQALAKVNRQIAEEAAIIKKAQDTNNELTKLNLHLEELREMVVHKCRKMSAEDKRQLSTGLCHLPFEEICKAIEIVAKKDPSFHSNIEFVDLDLDKQSESTLWKLRLLLKDAMQNHQFQKFPDMFDEASKQKNVPRVSKNSKRKNQNNAKIINFKEKKGDV
ncbi:transcription factor GTE6-like [Dioscorea cayenensis subsp. rotundata]|uniref:Transcription factor GTE6-like n=1 Tax=Dioscorea cayennensis subsp. rotundata TaxID=55577 RepID=A0AB40B9K5_DIOCR|nr:transcription factor GTE6-like [Dioscorea cayenensis subsp. rotundata]